jgi:hypothetical protein
MIGNLQGRLTALEESTPGGYQTFDRDGNIVIDSPLPAGKWFTAALDLLRNGSPEERTILKGQLRRSCRARGGGHLWEVVLAHTAFVCRTKDGELVSIDSDDAPMLKAAAQARFRGEKTEHDELLDTLCDYDVRQLAAE